jgi:hypothetical protein
MKDDPGQIALYARFFGNSFAEIKRKAQRHSWPVIRPPLPLTIHLARDRFLGCFLGCHWHPIPLCDHPSGRSVGSWSSFELTTLIKR